MMNIPIANLSIGFHELDFEKSPATFGFVEKDNFKDPINITVRVDKSESHIYLKVEVKVLAKLECDRCLKAFEKELVEDFSLYYEVKNSSRGESVKVVQEKDIEFRHYSVGDSHLDITEDIRTTLFLAMPMKNLCAEDCKGICPGCGQDLNQSNCICEKSSSDPRWDALNKLRE